VCGCCPPGTFVKALDGEVSQSHEELGGPAKAESQSGAGLARLLHQAEPDGEKHKKHKITEM